MQISKPEIIEQKDSIIYLVRVNYKQGQDSLWFSLNKEHEHLLSTCADAAFVALLIPAMAMGEDIHIEGAISENLYRNIVDRYQVVLKTIIPSLNIINIYPTDLKDEISNENGVATGFSGGIDSFTVLADYYYRNTTPGFRLTHLLFNNVGSHGTGSEYLFHERYNSIKETAENIELPLIAVNSNLSYFYKDIGFQQTHTHRNVSVAHLLKGGIKRFLYASTFSYGQTFIGQTYDIAYSDPIILPLLSSDALDCISVGCEYTRVEKTKEVAKIKESYHRLNICIRDDKAENCSLCWKCMRTLLTLEMLDCLHLYKNVFDISAYFNQRNRFIAQVIKSKDPLLREIKDYAGKNGFKFPLISHVYPYATQQKVFRLASSVKKRMGQYLSI